MFQRGQRPASSSSTAPEEAFTLDVEDLYAENSISAAVAVTLLAKGTQAGVAANPSLASRSTKKNFLKNAARTMRNRKLKGSQWPDLYWFSIPQLFEKKAISCFEKKTDGLQWKHAVQSFLLPSHSFEACNQSVNESDISHALGVQHGTQLATSNCDLWMSANLSIPFCSLASKSQTFKPLCHLYEQNSCWLVLVHARAQASIMYDLAMELLRHATIDIHSTLDCLSLKT